MICSACDIGIRFEVQESSTVHDLSKLNRDYQPGGSLGFDIAHGFCPQCAHLIVLLRQGQFYTHESSYGTERELHEVLQSEVIFPQTFLVRRVQKEVPGEYQAEFLEASAVLQISPRASAAMSRRILQRVLRDELSIKHRTLAGEIDEFMSQPGVPSHLAGAVDAIRNIGNFSAHPIKSQHTGEIVAVEPGEAEWLLEVLESLFDFVFVQPKRLEEKRKALDQKLAASGKPPMKR